MFHRFKERFGTAGLIAGLLALVLALGGTALAASGALTGKQKKEVEKIAKKYAGQPGAQGAAGAQGPVGPAGASGKDGTNGKDGANGTSVTSEEFSGTKEGHCAGQGGSKFTSASGNAFACNGKEGKAGEPWSAVLKSGQTETGVWAAPIKTAGIAAKALVSVTINFPVRLEEAIQGGHEHYINSAGKEVKLSPSFSFEEVTSTTCTGTASAPTATSGNLCVYAGYEENILFFNGSFVNPETGVQDILSNGASVTSAKTGALLVGEMNEATLAKAGGTWAVTAP